MGSAFAVHQLLPLRRTRSSSKIRIYPYHRSVRKRREVSIVNHETHVLRISPLTEQNLCGEFRHMKTPQRTPHVVVIQDVVKMT